MTHGAAPSSLPEDVYEAPVKLTAKGRLEKIMYSKPNRDIPLAVGDLGDVLLRHYGQKRGKLTSPRSLLSFNRVAWTVTVPESHGRTVSAPIENFRNAVGDDELAHLVRLAND